MEKFGIRVGYTNVPIAHRIVGVDRSGPSHVFLLSCLTEGCSGSFPIIKYKISGTEHCNHCLYVNVFGHWLDKRFEPVKHLFVAMSREIRKKGDLFTKFWLRCQTRHCMGVFPSYDWLQKAQTKCRDCRRKSKERLLFGHHVKEDDIWAMRDRIVGTRLSNTQNSRQWYVKCSGIGCKEKILYRRDPKYKGTCLGCRTKLRRFRPYESLYNVLKKTAAERGMECSISYFYFADLCNIAKCFYCEKDLKAMKWLERKITSGRGYMLDRVDNDRGYHVNNVVPSCMPCNSIKKNYRSALETLLLVSLRKGNHVRATEAAKSLRPMRFYRSWLADELRKVRQNEKH